MNPASSEARTRNRPDKVLPPLFITPERLDQTLGRALESSRVAVSQRQYAERKIGSLSQIEHRWHLLMEVIVQTVRRAQEGEARIRCIILGDRLSCGSDLEKISRTWPSGDRIATLRIRLWTRLS